MGRRSSYASVVAGAASGSSPAPQAPTRSGALSHLMNQMSSPSLHAQHPPSMHHSRNPSRGPDVDMHADGGGHALSASWSRRMPPMPAPAAHLEYMVNGHGHFGANGASPNKFFVPTYLRDSKYVERLAEAHKAKLAAQRDAPSGHSSAVGSLSTSSSSANLHKMAPSHRGMTYDIIEKDVPAPTDLLRPLPASWNDADKNVGIEIQGDGLEVRFVGPSKSHEHEAAAVRADQPMSAQCGIYYFEITIISKGKEGLIGMGFSGAKVPLTRLPGWEPDSWAYHGDDGRSFCCQSQGRDYGPKFSTRDVIGCGVNFRTGCAFFTKNGVNLGTAFRDIKGTFYPSVGMKRPGEHIRVNFGQSPFVFDIDSVMAREKIFIQEEINATSSLSLYPPLDENSLVRALVAQFLAHDGYIETARAFAEEVRTSKNALRDWHETLPDEHEPEPKEDVDAVHRQRIRMAILDGDVDKALKHTYAYYPSVLKDNEQIYFRLRCRKFIEMIRQCAELNLIEQAVVVKPTEAAHQASADTFDSVFEHEMELDEQSDNGSGWEKMETEEARAGLKHLTMLQETIKYGQVLQSEFRDDDRREVKKALEETFSLLAYEDPKSSVVAHLLEPSGRVPVAEELNSAILVSLGKSSSAALERLCQQTEVLLHDLGEDGGAGAFVHVRHDFLTR
ncbi:MAG: hypothetical protein M1838_001904 [Thelocarpon superellum]|nr:MAG: hypothetical protein M1838_001904 [Thelocarpon superellum]